MTADETIHSRPCPDCYVCGTPGEPLYQNLRDRLFDAPGEWNLKRCPNSDCGLLWLDPMPIEKDIGKAYAHYYTHETPTDAPKSFHNAFFTRILRAYFVNKFGYALRDVTPLDQSLARMTWLLPGHRAQWNAMVFHIPAVPFGRFLEIGCGNGATLIRLRELGWQVEGIELDHKAAQIARRRGIKVHLGQVYEQRYPNNTFDAVAMSHLIEHVHNPRCLLRECRRITKPGGHVVSITPNASSWGHRHYGRFWRGLEPPRHLHIFTSTSLRHLANQSGWSTPSVFGSVSAAHGILLASYRGQKGLPAKIHDKISMIPRLCGRFAQVLEALNLVLHPTSGEELVMIARKNSTL